MQAIGPELRPAAFALDVEGAGLDEGEFRADGGACALAIHRQMQDRRPRDNNWQDALIAEAAKHHGLVLATADKMLAEIATAHDVVVRFVR